MIVVFRKFRKLDFLFLSLNFERMIDIRDISGRIKLSVSIGSGSLHRFELMKEDYISIVFSLETPIQLEIGDNVDYEGSLYYITDKVYPTFNASNGGYDYTLRLESHYYRWKNHILFYDRQGNKEASWSLTRSPEAHLGIVVSNLRTIGFTFNGKEYQAIVDSSVDPVAKLVQYDNTNIIDALTKIAEAWECEWWVDGDKIYLGHLEHGEPVNLEIGKEISSMSRSQSQDIFATRLYAFGSTRNIPSDYRKGETGAVVEGVVQKRLMLPAGTPYVDVIEGLEEEQVVEAVVIFEDIYPRVTGTITEVISKEVTDEDDSGDPVTFTVYRFKDENLVFKEEYVLPGQDLHVIFQNGPLSGMDFALEFNPDRLPEDDPKAQVFEIVRNDTYGQTLPESPLIPGTGNKYILYNFDTRYVNDALIPQAEQELLERTIAYKDKVVSDPSTYTCSLNSYRASGYDENNGLLNPEKEINLLPGQKVNLINKAYFENGRISRVIGFEKKLDIPYDSPVYTIGESAAYSRLGELEQKLDNIQFKGNTYVNQGGGFGVYIVKKDDTTAASDENVFSALRTLYEINKAYVDISDMYLRKDIPDTAHEDILFDKKIGSSIFIDDWEGKGWEITAPGTATFDSLRVRSDIYVGGNTGSPTFASGFTGWGWQIDTLTATGEMDNLFIRKTFTAYEIVYSQIYGLGGSQIVSDINKIARVEVMPDRYRCYMDDMDGLMLMNLRKGDGVRIQTRTGTASIKYLFGRCIGVDSDHFDIAIPLIEGTGQPEAGDFALRWGNNEDTDRQGLIYLTTADSGAPFIDVYDGITDASTEGKLKARLGHLTGIRTQRGDQLFGYGAYLNGIYVENSTFILQNGDSIEQTFIAMNGKFESLIDGIRNDISAEGGNILVNSSFSQNTNYWTAENVVHFINVGGEYLWLDGSFYVEKDQVADIYNDNGQNVLRIRNTYILQQNAIMNIPDHTEGEEKMYSFSLFYKVLRPGSCGFGIPGTELYHEEQLSESDSYQKLSKVGKWNGKGDFELRFTGEILIYGVGLFSDEIADAIVHLQTQITQNEEEIKLRATKDYVDAETGKIYTKYDTSLSLKADKAELTSFKEEYDEFQQVVRRDYATQSWTSNKIQTEVGSYVDGALVGYATTSWTSNQISSSVRGLASETYVNQTANGLNININSLGNRVDNVEGELDSVADITGAFYSFGANKMRLNRRIEMGTGSNTSFQCVSGISPDTSGAAFWAGSTYENQLNAKIKLNHDGSGWLGSGNITWRTNGDTTITGTLQTQSEGKRVTISPANPDRFISFYNENQLVGKMGLLETDNNLAYLKLGVEGTGFTMELSTAGLVWRPYYGSQTFDISQYRGTVRLYGAWPTDLNSFEAKFIRGTIYVGSDNVLRVKPE